ncbi:MAG: class I SAM-dependent methyltransferase [candidate division Zixibacteria bacterium]|nr:class I SAM-dependent methyltransferase [Candidatus Tariuqbacter arcticus]
MYIVSYNPTYVGIPFTEFSTIDENTDLENLNLNWREQDLPERVRTKHVHRLHPYLGKFIPQLVEIFLRKYRPNSVLDPFCGCGTTLVQANELGIKSIGCDISIFNCMISKVKTDKYDLSILQSEILELINKLKFEYPYHSENDFSDYLKTWYSQKSLDDLFHFKETLESFTYNNLYKVILSRAARSARLTTHYDLDFPKKPIRVPYYCRKHSRICYPVKEANKFLIRYCNNTFKRIVEFAEYRTDADVVIINGDSSNVVFPKVDIVITSPPYVGLIDYHEQHRYAYDLLNLPSNDHHEIGSATNGSGQKAQKEYKKAMMKVYDNLKTAVKRSGIIITIINDKYNLFNPDKFGFVEEMRLKRHVNRRTGMRKSNFFEEILIWRNK